MKGYNPIEPNNSKPKESIFPCINWSFSLDKCVTKTDYKHLKLNKEDFDINCEQNKGKSNSQRCCYYNPKYITQWNKNSD